MDKLEELIMEIRQMNESLRKLIHSQSPRPNFQKIPAAARQLGMSPALLRKLCKNEIIPSISTNTNTKMKHYLVDIDEVEKLWLPGGYYETKQLPTKRGPKPKAKIL